MRKALYALSLLAAAPLAHAADFTFGLSNKALAADFTSQPIGQGLEFTVGGLHHSDNGNVGTTGLQVSQQINSNFAASLGGKIYFIQNDTRNASAIALGGMVDMALPALPQVHVGAHGWYAPKVTSFNHTDSVQDLGASISYRVLSNGEVFAAYRNVRIEYQREGGLTIQNGVLFGMKLSF
ncbi:MAG: YfaZ family outer membrane protein [Rhizobacter sp.]